MKKAALFDLDGVIFHTEPLYDIFWEGISREFRPDTPEMVRQMKGQTMVYTLNRWFSGPYEHLRGEVVRRMNEFESHMVFEYVPGFQAFLEDIRSRGVRTAVVTSSNLPKMANVYRRHPEFREMFDAILTSEDFSRSKPAPDCYLVAARRLGLSPADCVVFEDSLNGLRSGTAAGMFTVALCTTLPPATLRPLSSLQLPDFTAARWDALA